MISIVTSAFNASATISRAIESVQSQSFKDWEMIVINDCSTDNTAEIIESYAINDSRIRLVNHEVNKGAGLARRTGIANIRGEWMTFLDSDDYLKEDCLEILYNAAINYKADIVSPGYIRIDSSNHILENKIPKKHLYIGENKFKPNKEDTKRFMNPMLIKSILWDKITYSHRRFIEDTITLVKLLYYADSILTLDYAGYYYVQNPVSLTHSSNIVKYCIFKTLSVKDTIIFFNNVGIHMSNKEFIKEYSKLLELDIEDEEYELYKNELDELYNYYLTIAK